MDALRTLTAVEEIRKLKARYFRTMDTKDWAGFADVFAPDAEASFLSPEDERISPGGVFTGQAEITAFIRDGLVGITTAHYGHMAEIEVESSTTARGIWSMEDHLWFPPGQDWTWRKVHGFGHYHETYRQANGDWRIQTLNLTRVHLDTHDW